MENNSNLFGCFVSSGALEWDDPVQLKNKMRALNAEFRTYIFGNNGICPLLKLLSNDKYGNDLRIILLEFYVLPSQDQRKTIRPIGSYRKKEKSIGIPIIVTNENFFLKSHEERYEFLFDSINSKWDLLEKVIKRNKLDTDLKSIKADLEIEFVEKGNFYS